MSSGSDITKSLAQQSGIRFETLEQPLGSVQNNQELRIGIPKSNTFSECRVPLTPESVEVMVARGQQISVEAGAGLKAGFSDQDYSEAGAKIVYDAREIFQAHIVVKMSPITAEELDWMTAGQIILSPIHLPTMTNEVMMGILSKKVIALAYEYIKDEVKHYPIVHAFSEIGGRASMLIAGQLLNNQNGGQGLLLGGVAGVKPTKVIILGAGTVGESAARAAMGFGSQVKVFDNNIYKLRRLQNNLGQRMYTSIINPRILAEELKTADVAIGAIHSKIARTPIIVTEEMVQGMPEQSVIIDVSIDQGGVFETSELTSMDKPTFVKYGVIHYCVPNISSMFPVTASNAISNILYPMFLTAQENGGFEEAIRQKKGLRKGVYAYKGKLTNEYLSQRFEYKYTDLELLMATGFGN